MQTGKTNFNNQNHAFHFVNRFEFPDVMNVRLSFLKLTDIVYGLCGGMSFAAIDYYKLGLPVPDFDQPEEISVKLFRYLWNRQLDSLRGGTLRKLLVSMLRSDTSLGKVVVNDEIPRLRSLIDQGIPAVLALVRVKGFRDPTRNHQVLATGYEYDPQSRQITLDLYDPNHPRREPQIRINMADLDRGIQITQSTGEALRGFFLIDYNTETPPA